MFELELHHGKCEDIIPTLTKVDIVVTSPPYNFSMKYNEYKDDMPYDNYLQWTDLWVSQIKEILKPEGSFFLNIGHKPSHTTLPYDVLSICRRNFVLQNNFIWVKSISVGENNFGQFKSINSERFVNDMWEHVFHFTHKGDIKLNRLSIGVPYKDKSNVNRWSSKIDKRCRGNVWFIPYETVNSKKEHPAMFPFRLPYNCLSIAGVSGDSVVLDPFIGSGTTALVCRALDCKCIGIDLDDYYLNMVKEKCDATNFK